MMKVGVGEIEATVKAALVRSGAREENARPVARAIARAEAEGNAVCGLFYVPIFCRHLEIGKLDGNARPMLGGSSSALIVDAADGFAHPAIETGLPALAEGARRHGIAALAVTNSYNCLALSHHVTPLADEGLIGIVMSNAPASVAPPGATRPLFGTNPIAYAIPADEGMIVVDQSMSAVTKTAIMMRRDAGEPIPTGWAQDAEGNATTDPATGLAGSLLPAGGQKGANLSLLVEVLAAALTGSTLSTAASAFGNDEGGPPRVGQFLIAIDPGHFAGAGFAPALASLAAAFGTAGVRLPGRRSRDGSHSDRLVEVDADRWASTRALAGLG